MTLCENKLFINCIDQQRTNGFMEILSSENLHFFQSLIPLEPNQTKLEAYGTDSDVYTDYIDFHQEHNDFYITVYTHDTPCIQFCQRLSKRYSISVQLVYYNEELNFSGKFQNEQLHQWGFYEGLYLTDPDRFWELENLNVNDLPFLSTSEINTIKKRNIENTMDKLESFKFF